MQNSVRQFLKQAADNGGKRDIDGRNKAFDAGEK